MKLIIAGGRDFDNEELMLKSLNWYQITEVVCGKAKGADSLGEKLANKFQIPVVAFPADWEKNGKAAGPIRNVEMGNYADALIAFWDGKSKGTKHMIDYMKKLGKPVKVVSY